MTLAPEPMTSLESCIIFWHHPEIQGPTTSTAKVKLKVCLGPQYIVMIYVYRNEFLRPTNVICFTYLL